MLIIYLKFGMCNYPKSFMVMFRCHVYAPVIFVDFSEYLCLCLLIMLFYGNKLIKAIWIMVW